MRYALSVEPKPSVLTQTVDADGNDVAYAWFEEPTDSLEIATDFAVDTLRDNPFDFLALGEGAPRLPIAYPAGVRERLAAELCSSEADGRAIEGLVLPLVEQGLDDPTAFLGALNRAIHERFEVTVREQGGPLAPRETIRAGRAACRDLAVLFMHCCRTVGVAARFVSGYQQQGESPDGRYMHAWAEAYLPGGGWRGYDPTHGLSVADRHIAVAASADPRWAAPIRGSYRGDAGAGQVEVTIEVATDGG